MLTCGLVVALACLAGQSVELVRDGRPVAVLVSTAPAKSDEALAAGTLAEWIAKITGASLPIVAQAPADQPAILVGQAALAAGLKVEAIASPSREGLRVVADGRRVLLAGQSPAATLKAACRLLEALGCRYLMDGPLGECYPRARDLSVPPLDLTEQPGLLGRNPKGPSWSGALWKAWNGAGGVAYRHQHAWGSYLPRDLFDRHPDWFAQGADGQRKRGDWLCTSNRELRAWFAQQVVKAIDAGQQHPSISPPDGRGYCQCAACRAQDDPQSREPSTGMVSLTNRYVDFFDDVARTVAKTHPGSVLCFYCYADYTQPPTLGRKLAPNLCAVIAPIRYCRLHAIGHPGCPSREQQVAMVDGWAKAASRLGYYSYCYNLADGTLPFCKYTAYSRELPYLKARGLGYLTIEVLSNWQVYGPQIWLALRLAYDPGADAAALLDDYCRHFYGPRAALPMRDYWLALDAAQNACPSHAGSFFGLAQAFTPDLLLRSDQLLTRAEQAVGAEEPFSARVGLHRAGWRSAADYQRISRLMAAGDFPGAQRVYDELAKRLTALAERRLANPEYATAYLRRFLLPALQAGVAATAAPGRLVSVLPERWRFALDEQDRGLAEHWAAPGFDDARWPLVSTWERTLDGQGFDRPTVLWYRTRFTVPAEHRALSLVCTEIDGVSQVWLNGTPLPPPGTKARAPFSVPLGAAARPGENLVALRVDHSRITELALGGLLRPVLLVEQ